MFARRSVFKSGGGGDHWVNVLLQHHCAAQASEIQLAKLTCTEMQLDHCVNLCAYLVAARKWPSALITASFDEHPSWPRVAASL